MVLRFGQKGSSKAAGKGEDVTSLIAKKNYARAIELIKVQLKSPRAEPRLRMQLADVLVLTGKTREAVMILTPLADEFAREGFAAKAIAVLKKIQKIDPTRREVEGKLASLIQEKQQQASVAISSPAPGMEIGIEEIGFEPPAGGSIAVPVDRPASIDVEPSMPAPSAATAHEPPQPFPKPEPPPPPQPFPEPEPLPPAQPTPATPPEPVARPSAPARHFEIEEAGIELEAEPLPEPAPVSARPQQTERPIVVLEPQPEPEPIIVPEPEPTVAAEPELSLAPEPVPVQPASSEREFVLDDEDEFQLDEAGETVEAAPDESASEAPLEVEAEAEASQPVTDNVFVDELMSVLEEAFPSGLEAPFTQPIAPSPSGSAQIVVSPLFRHFSVDEMVAVIAGLNLRSCERGEVIIREGEPGDRLFMLSSGRVKAFRKGPTGKQVPLAVLEEGAFFGEGAMLTGKPRTASIVALEECELLELDRATLDSIVQQHPHVMDVMREFAAQRAIGR